MEWIYKYISVTAVIGTLGLSIRYLIQKKIDSYFNKKLEDHKKEIAIITEQAKYNISKKLFDFEAYASKKHTIYPELQWIILELWSELVRFRYRFDVELKITMRGSDSDELLTYFHANLNPIGRKILDAHDYFYKNDLYLSKNVSLAFKEALQAESDFKELMTNSFERNCVNVDWDDPNYWLIEVDVEDFNKTGEKVNTLKETIYNELSYTHFEKVE